MDLIKHSALTPADEMAHQTITDSGNFTQDACILFITTLYAKSRALICNWHETCTLIWVLSALSPRRSPLMLFQEWLDKRNAMVAAFLLNKSACASSWNTDSSCIPCAYPCYFCTFVYDILFPSIHSFYLSRESPFKGSMNLWRYFEYHLPQGCSIGWSPKYYW